MIRYIYVLGLAATLVVMGGPAAAQSQGSWLDTLPQKVNAISAAVAPEGHVVLATGSVFVQKFDDVICAASNVGTESMMVLPRIVASDGTVSYGGGDGNPILVEPGKTIYGSASVTVGDFRRCEFEFDGLAQNVRATLTYVGTAGPQLALDAR